MTSVGQVLESNEPDITVVAVEPAESTVLSGDTPVPHRIQALGAGFVLDVLDTEIYDTVCRVERGRHRHPRHKGALIMVVLPATGDPWLSSNLFHDE